MVYIETERLLLRDWKEEDIAPFAEMNSDPEVMRFFLKPLNSEESFDFYNHINKEFVEYGYGLYAIEKKENSTFIGYTGFHNFNLNTDFTPGVEIGWRIRHGDWNKGYATEAAKACLNDAKYHLPFHTVWSFTSVLNKRSEKIMQKTGMEKTGYFFRPAVPDHHPLKEHVLYKTTL